MKTTRILLYFAAFICLSGFVGVFLPMGSMVSIAGRYGATAGADSPFCVYSFRLAMSVMAGCSVLFFIIARDPAKHGPLVPASGGVLVFVGAVLTATGMMTSMPPSLFVFDGLICGLPGVAVVVSWFLGVRGRG
ncbi:MAG: hypothetical protein ACYTFG_07570 [Planctomycetota bacterium]|jgi:hypothetical protein